MSRKPFPLPTVQRLRELLHYDSDAGVLYWKSAPAKSKSKLIGKEAGSLVGHDAKFYKSFQVDGQKCLVHRIIWLLETGDDPGEMQIDHIDGNRLNNRFENLRLATVQQNSANVGLMKNNTSGYRGVCWHKHLGKWMSRIGVGGKRITLGFFDTAEDAYAAYRDAAARHFGEYAVVIQPL